MNSSKSRSPSKSKSKRMKQKPKREVYYFCMIDTNSHIVHQDDTHYTNKIIIPLYLTPDMNESIVGYYTAFNIHNVTENKNKIHTAATIITPNGTVLATSDYVVDKNKNYLDVNTQKRVNFQEETGSGYYKSPQIVVTVLSSVNRKLSITCK